MLDRRKALEEFAKAVIHELSLRPRLATEIPMLVIYDHPLDYPDSYAARLWYSNGRPTDVVFVNDDVEFLRYAFSRRGMTRLARNEADDPGIMETWV